MSAERPCLNDDRVPQRQEQLRPRRTTATIWPRVDRVIVGSPGRLLQRSVICLNRCRVRHPGTGFINSSVCIPSSWVGCTVLATGLVVSLNSEYHR